MELALAEIILRRVSGQKMHKNFLLVANEKVSFCCKIILVAHCMVHNFGGVAYVVWHVQE